MLARVCTWLVVSPVAAAGSAKRYAILDQEPRESFPGFPIIVESSLPPRCTVYIYYYSATTSTSTTTTTTTTTTFSKSRSIFPLLTVQCLQSQWSQDSQVSVVRRTAATLFEARG